MDRTVRFAPRRSFKSGRVFVITLGGFTVIGIVLVFVVDWTIGLAMSGFSGFMLTVVLLQSGKIGWEYRIDSKGIWVKRTFRSHVLPKEAIRSVEEISWNRAQEVLRASQIDEVSAVRNADIIGGFRAQIELGRIIGYSSVPIVFSETRSGSPTHITSVGSYSHGSFVLVTQDDHRTYLLSPVDTSGFLQACRDAGIIKN